jgi:hypothetical protein
MLDGLAAIFSHGQDLTATAAQNVTVSRYSRCERRRAAIRRAAAGDLDLLLRAQPGSMARTRGDRAPLQYCH